MAGIINGMESDLASARLLIGLGNEFSRFRREGMT